jgi:hypothetical protein
MTALIISSCGFFGTVYWFENGKNVNRHGLAQPIARLIDVVNEVQRKPLKRVIWESVNRNDEFYPGEAVRTSPNGEARLQFIKSGAAVRLEADSLVVLEENDKGLSLDFLQGNLFVQASGADPQSEGLTLKTGGGEIKLKAADMSLSKAQNGNVNLEVHRGEAELDRGGKSTALSKEKSAVLTANGVSVTNDRLQTLKPQAGEILYLNLSKGEKVELAWKPLPAGYRVNVEVGAQRGNMKALPSAHIAGEIGRFGFAQKPGRWYMRLVATSDDSKQPPMSSTVIPFSIEPKSPPSLVEPRQEAAVLKPAADAEMAFKWVNRHKLLSQFLEISTDPQFKSPQVRQSLAGDATTFSVPLADGAYFWRVTGYLKIKDKSEALSSAIGKFSILSKLEIRPPVLVTPSNEQHLSLVEAQKNGVPLKWQAPKGVDTFKVKVERKDGENWSVVYVQDSQTTQARIADLNPGTYRWAVTSVDPNGEDKAAAPFQFTIDDLQKIEWAEGTGEIYQYHSPTPSLAAHWKPLSTPPTLYRFKLALEGKSLNDETWQTTRQTGFESPIPADGNYQIVIEAVNAKGEMYAQSDIKSIVVNRRPLLPPPQWPTETPPVLKTDNKGNLTFGWEQVEGARRYLMVLEGSDGKIVEQKEVTRTTASFSRLQPGEYRVHLKSVDDFKRVGPEGDRRKIEVPDSIDIRAPKIKAIKVK